MNHNPQMNIISLHNWNLTAEEAIAVQASLSDRVVLEDQLGEVKYVAGVDVGFEEEGAVTRAAVAVLELEKLHLKNYQPCDRAIARCPTTMPYIPGLLSFREIPAVLGALEKLQITPNLLLCDGQGTAHPRRFGIACHLGLLTDIPAIGVAKSRLIGHHAPIPDPKGSWQPLLDKSEKIGVALRTRPGTHPLYISPGHNISLDTAIAYVLRCTTKYRLPETTRHAHKLASGPAIDAPQEPPEVEQMSLIMRGGGDEEMRR
jgi:deoxyribonuclease V